MKTNENQGKQRKTKEHQGNWDKEHQGKPRKTKKDFLGLFWIKKFGASRFSPLLPRDSTFLTSDSDSTRPTCMGNGS